MMVPIQVMRWYRMQCYDGTDSCAIVVPIRRYCQWTDKVVIDRFLNKEHLYGVNVYPMDMVGFDEEYMTMTEQKCARLKSCNKEKVVYLASKVEEKVDGCRMLCIIDRDWDTLFSKESNGRYLASLVSNKNWTR